MLAQQMRFKCAVSAVSHGQLQFSRTFQKRTVLNHVSSPM